MLIQHVWYSHDTTILLQPCVVNLCNCNIFGMSRLYQTCWNNLATSLIMSSSLLQVVNSLFQTCCNNMGTSSENTTCWQLLNRFVTTCLQTCYNLCVFMRGSEYSATNPPQCHTIIHNYERTSSIIMFAKCGLRRAVFSWMYICALWGKTKIYTTRKNAQVVTGLQTSCYKSVHKLSASCVRTACSHVVATSLEQAVNNL